MSKFTPIRHDRKDNRQCIRCNSRPVLLNKGTWYSLCEQCLKETELGPYKVRLPQVGEDYKAW